jgi:membrane peptidoglycan carboxypeptidase
MLPASGPYDQRLGYARLPEFVKRLEGAGFRVERQARLARGLRRVREWGLFPTYREKSQAGLRILDREERLLYAARHPQQVYESFESIPPVVVAALLFIENRDMLDTRHPGRNPAVDWGRLGKAVGVRTLTFLGADRKAIGGSTLATQLEKFRHSPEGRTSSGREKLRQMISASLRAYQEGENTLPARRRIVLDYINSVPLAAVAGYGEVNGLGDGLQAWYGRDLEEVNRLLSAPADTAERALAYKQVLSLFLSQRRPSDYLGEDRKGLEALTDAYLRLLAREGAISPQLRDLALGTKLAIQQRATPPAPSLMDRKGADLLRNRLAAQLGLPSLYDLDRLDLSVASPLDGPTQVETTRVLQALRDPEYVEAAGLKGFRLLERGDPAGVVYALTLFERRDGANLVRVQTDSLNQPFDVNDGMKLDLGSTAKLRTLVSYLEIVSSLHGRYGNLPPGELRGVQPERGDRLTAWAVSYLATAKDRGLAAMLEAALSRTYSASPAEGFFTGGGVHTFSNFKAEDNGRVMTVREATQHSVNLVFVRLMRDVVGHYAVQATGSQAELFQDLANPQRREYLKRFADREGGEFLGRFYQKHRGKTPQESLKLLIAGTRPTPERLATILGSVDPSAGPVVLAKLAAEHLPGQSLSDEEAAELLDRYSPAHFSLMDRGYIARVHPLELWLAAHLRGNPRASLSQVLAASASERQEVYGWLFKTTRKHAQDRRIATLLELEAFLKIHASWQRLGYPFAYLTPSLATALGSSGDRPAALAELMGILANDGVRLPSVRAERLRFAADTPYETVFVPQGKAGERVLAPEVAAAARRVLVEVVEGGTAQRLRKALARPDGTLRVVAGKTGTGDERHETYGAGGRVIDSRFVSRAATFVFLIGDRFFGTLTAYVRGPEAANYRFTSSLPVAILGILMPTLSPLLDGPGPAGSEPDTMEAVDRKPVARVTTASWKPADPPARPPAESPGPAARVLPVRKLRAEVPDAGKVFPKQALGVAPHVADPSPPLQHKLGTHLVGAVDRGSDPAEDERIHLP